MTNATHIEYKGQRGYTHSVCEHVSSGHNTLHYESYPVAMQHANACKMHTKDGASPRCQVHIILISESIANKAIATLS